jgi:hypothetical protein
MPYIDLTQGYVAEVDEEDWDDLMQFKWTVYNVKGRPKYAVRSWKEGGRTRTEKMHRRILGVTNPKVHVDHINGSGLDNTRKNLRVASASQNAANQAPYQGSEYKGVSFHKKDGLWHARIGFEKHIHFIGAYKCARDAALAYNGAATALFGDYARLNDVAHDPKECCGNCNHCQPEEHQSWPTCKADDKFDIAVPFSRTMCRFSNQSRWTERETT